MVVDIAEYLPLLVRDGGDNGEDSVRPIRLDSAFRNLHAVNPLFTAVGLHCERRLHFPCHRPVFIRIGRGIKPDVPGDIHATVNDSADIVEAGVAHIGVVIVELEHKAFLRIAAALAPISGR